MLSDFENDLNIITHCINNEDDQKCRCINLSNNLEVYSKSSFSPAYCWYSPCNDINNYKTSIIKSERQYCNITICEISVDDIKLNDNGNVQITNDCISTINPIINFSQSIIDLSTIELPNLLINFIFPITIILLLIIL
ncbi:membrane protein [Alphaentomopoxvirus acuprea]|uniref:Membrane protein n=1 Tax=Alphaentomopoxvirus acuprea TaxID=62099 RepID=W6JIN2_9POXV|nr:membrane protein [Anomala cuprea entomopoxvirus]BAO49402.1 membrane protein [Anomala cuprea entomopoxvirus]